MYLVSYSVAQTCIQRGHRFKGSPEVTSFSICEPIKLRRLDDTTKIFFLGMVIDSISDIKKDYIIYVYSINDPLDLRPGISIGFSDGVIRTLNPYRINFDDEYYEFLVDQQTLMKLFTEKFDYFSINSLSVTRPWVDIKYHSRSYFKDFLNTNNYKRVDVQVITKLDKYFIINL